MSEKDWLVYVSRSCVGAGLCVAVAPDHFEFSDGRAQTTADSVQSVDTIEQVRTAAAMCPAAAISLTRKS
jgi:ferredoxin